LDSPLKFQGHENGKRIAIALNDEAITMGQRICSNVG